MLRTIAVALLVVVAQTASVSWTGEGTGNLWTDAANWDVNVPTADDDVTISGAQVLLGVLPGGSAKSLTLKGSASLTVQGCSLEVGEGGIMTADSAAIMVSTGASAFSSKGKITLGCSSGNGLEWDTGVITADIDVKSGCAMSVSGTNTDLTLKGGITNAGKVTLSSTNTHLQLNSIANTGTVNFGTTVVSTTSLSNNGTFAFKGANVNASEASGTGKATFDSTNTVSFASGMLTSGSVATGTTSSGAGRLAFKGITIAKGAALTGTMLSLAGASGEGTLQVGAQAQISGSVNLPEIVFVGRTALLNSLVFNKANGSVTKIHSQAFAPATVNVSDDSALKVDTVQVEDGSVMRFGSGAMSPSNIVGTAGTFHVQKDFKLTVGSKLDLYDAYIYLDGEIVNPKGSVVTQYGSKKIESRWAPTKGTTFGKFTNEGTFQYTMGSSNVTFHNVEIDSTGNFTINGTLDMEDLTATFTKLTMATSSSSISGESLKISYNELDADKKGATVIIQEDSGLNQCTSPCPSYKSPSQWQTYKASIAK